MKLIAHLECELFPRELEIAAKFIRCPGHFWNSEGIPRYEYHTAPVIVVEETYAKTK